MRSLSKALFSALSEELSPEGLAIFIQKLCSFSRRESATFPTVKTQKIPNLAPIMTTFKNENGMSPPQQVGSSFVEESNPKFSAPKQEIN